jgi:DNA-binding NarL/FixJ family response regulator
MIDDPAEQPIPVVVIHHRTVAREGMATLIQGQRGIRLAGTVASAHQLLEQAPSGELVIVYDYDTARRDERAWTTELRARLPEAKFLIYNVPDNDDAIIECAEVGVDACMLEDVSVEGLMVAIRSLHEGAPLVSPRVITSLFNHIANRQGESRRRSAGLTRREEEILELMAEGYSNKEIANQLFLQHQTVKNHVRAIFHKLDVHNRFEVMRSQWLARR